MKVSIIIPCYNVEKYILDCLRSVECQTYSSVEVICIDDGSTDTTLAMIRLFQEDSNLDVAVLEQTNKGAPAARNRGLEYSSGAYLQFLDADDLLLPFKIEEQIEFVKVNNRPDLVVGSYERHSMQGVIENKKIYQATEIKDHWIQLMATDVGITSANLFSRKVFQSGGLWNEDLNSSQEYELMFQMLKKGSKIIYDPHINTIVRTRDSGSISQSNLKAKWQQHVSLKEEILKYLLLNESCLVQDDFYQAFFENIRLLYPYDQKMACKLYQKYLPSSFKPKESSLSGRLYIFLFNLLGFRRTEDLRLLLRRTVAH